MQGSIFPKIRLVIDLLSYEEGIGGKARCFLGPSVGLYIVVAETSIPNADGGGQGGSLIEGIIPADTAHLEAPSQLTFGGLGKGLHRSSIAQILTQCFVLQGIVEITPIVGG